MFADKGNNILLQNIYLRNLTSNANGGCIVAID